MTIGFAFREWSRVMTNCTTSGMPAPFITDWTYEANSFVSILYRSKLQSCIFKFYIKIF